MFTRVYWTKCVLLLHFQAWVRAANWSVKWILYLIRLRWGLSNKSVKLCQSLLFRAITEQPRAKASWWVKYGVFKRQTSLYFHYWMLPIKNKMLRWMGKEKERTGGAVNQAGWETHVRDLSSQSSVLYQHGMTCQRSCEIPVAKLPHDECHALILLMVWRVYSFFNDGKYFHQLNWWWCFILLKCTVRSPPLTLQQILVIHFWVLIALRRTCNSLSHCEHIFTVMLVSQRCLLLGGYFSFVARSVTTGWGVLRNSQMDCRHASCMFLIYMSASYSLYMNVIFFALSVNVVRCYLFCCKKSLILFVPQCIIVYYKTVCNYNSIFSEYDYIY